MLKEFQEKAYQFLFGEKYVMRYYMYFVLTTNLFNIFDYTLYMILNLLAIFLWIWYAVYRKIKGHPKVYTLIKEKKLKQLQKEKYQ